MSSSRLASGPGIAIGLNKTLLHKAAEGDLDTALELGAIGGIIGEATDDHIEAIAAFREKREPQFNGSGASRLPAHDALSNRGTRKKGA